MHVFDVRLMCGVADCCCGLLLCGVCVLLRVVWWLCVVFALRVGCRRIAGCCVLFVVKLLRMCVVVLGCALCVVRV